MTKTYIPPVEPEYRTHIQTRKVLVRGEGVKIERVPVKQKKCQSFCGEWRDIEDFHYRTPDQKTRSSRCRFCAAKAQRDLRARKKGLLAKAPGGRFGVDTPPERASGRTGKRKAIPQGIQRSTS